jgi:hypothetical protein
MKEDFRTALETIYNELKDSNANWAIFGSMNLLLQGLPIDPRDIDILTDAEGAYEIEKALTKYSIRKVVYCSDGKVTSHFGALEIAGVKAEIVGDYTLNKDMQLILDVKDKIMILFEGMQIPCLPLEKELAAYDKEEKSERVKLIKETLG